MSTHTLAYYLLGIIVLIIPCFAVGTFIAGRLSRRRETAEQAWDETRTSDVIHTPTDAGCQP